MEVERFRVVRRVLVGLHAAGATLGSGIAVAALATGEPWWYAGVFLAQAASLGSMAFIFGRQTVVLTDDEIVATQGFQRQRVAWPDVVVVHLDWAAEAAGRDRDVLRIERTSGGTVRSSAATGMDGTSQGSEGGRLEAALRRRADAHGFTVEVTSPTWKSRGRDADRS